MAGAVGGGGHLRRILRVSQRLQAIEPFHELQQVVEVLSRDDLPAPIGGVITLDPLVVYKLLQPVDLEGDVLEGIDVTIIGDRSHVSTIETDSPNALLSTNGTGFFNLSGVRFLNPGGPLFDCDFGRDEPLFGLIMTGCSGGPGPKIGTIRSASRILIDGGFFFDFDDGFTFDGEVGEFIILNVSILASSAGSGFKGIAVGSSAVLEAARLNLLRFNTQDASDVCITMSSGASYPQAFRVIDCTHVGPGAFVQDLGVSTRTGVDPEVIAKGNSAGLQDSVSIGSAGFTGNSVTTVIASQGVSVPIGSGSPSHPLLAPVATEDFVLSGDETQLQILTYTGLLRQAFVIRWDGVIKQSPGPNATVQPALQVNGVLIPNSEADFDARLVEITVFCSAEISLNTGDTIRPVVANTTGTSNFVVVTAKWVVSLVG